MQARLFTSPLMKASEVKLWCEMARENRGKLMLCELQMKSAVTQMNKEKTAS